MFLVILGLAFACPLAGTAHALPGVVPAAEGTQAPTEPPVDPLGRETPRGSVTGLLDALARKDYAGAAAFLENTEPEEEPGAWRFLDRFPDPDDPLARRRSGSPRSGCARRLSLGLASRAATGL
ncbi:hypothetical protein I5L01_12250 [Erythrobacter sp. YJ-T3-07]|uniref:hypothetical protein n=1 Tax=Erythrobacter sp. YJ-T3-07 TaxID=2793063 RepID=UPI0018D3CD32|nr:hypothetical protein [Erythrobacter sp. YJ-T3-07]MBH1944992.1 hypothetical protein [Erythrobacter sp. YJ-T3-07]